MRKPRRREPRGPKTRRYRALVNVTLDLSKLGGEGELHLSAGADAVQIEGGDEVEYLVALCEGGYLIEEPVFVLPTGRSFGHHWSHCSHCADYDCVGVSCCYCHRSRPLSDFDGDGGLIDHEGTG